MNCFQDQVSNQSVCRTCGWDARRYKHPAQALPLRTVLQDHYLIGKVLGQGGFGITYAAWDTKNQLKVALKEYFPIDIAKRTSSFGVDINKEYNEVYLYGIQRFEDEVHALARFNQHPGIVTVFDMFEANNTAYMAMQYVEGKTWLDHALERGGKIPVEETLSTLLLACDALRAVHEVGMLHRDISPDNILITPNGQVKIIDFGAARYAMKQQQQVYSIIFKPGYTPEEQYRSSGHFGPWTDLYALAATFYRIITGVVPTDAMNRQDQDMLALPSQVGVHISPEFEAVMMKALAIKGSERYQTVEEFKSELLSQKGSATMITPEQTKSADIPNWVWLVGLVFIMLIMSLLY
jgi:serine/threonine protein kinase